jgi:hypothetical protein
METIPSAISSSRNVEFTPSRQSIRQLLNPRRVVIGFGTTEIE